MKCRTRRSRASDTAVSSVATSLPLNDTPLTATLLNPIVHSLSPTDARFDVAYKGKITDSGDTDYYRITGPETSNNASQTLIAMVWALDSTHPLYPRIHVFDASLNPVPVQVVTNAAGTYTIQFPQASSGGTYFVEVMAGNPSGANNVGNFFLALDFHAAPTVALQNFGGGTLSQSAPQDSASLTVNQTTLFHFVLSADAGQSAVQADVTMTICDQNGDVVFTLSSSSGQPPTTGDVYLKAGSFRISYVARARSGSFLPQLNYRLDGEVISDPVGAYSSSPTNSPTSPSGSPSGGGYNYGGSSSSRPSGSSPTYY